MSSEVARSWVDVGSFQTRLLVRHMIFTASVRNILDRAVYSGVKCSDVIGLLIMYTNSVAPSWRTKSVFIRESHKIRKYVVWCNLPAINIAAGGNGL
jgi:hypothetical protein